MLAALHHDVNWPNAWEGGRLHGKEAVAAYWVRQWKEIDPRVEPVSVDNQLDGRVAVGVHQAVHALDGSLLSDGRVLHVYEMKDGLVARMDVEEA
jgi:SnoaL-like domain